MTEVATCSAVFAQTPKLLAELTRTNFIACASSTKYSLLTATVPPTAQQLQQFCSDVKCKSIFTAIAAAGIPECKNSQGIMLGEVVLNKLPCLSTRGAGKSNGSNKMDSSNTSDKSNNMDSSKSSDGSNMMNSSDKSDTSKRDPSSKVPQMTDPAGRQKNATLVPGSGSGASVLFLSTITGIATSLVISLYFL